LGVSYSTGTGTGLGQYIDRFYITPGIYWNIKRDGKTHEPACGIRLTYQYGFTTWNRTTQKLGELPNTTDMINDLTISFHWAF